VCVTKSEPGRTVTPTSIEGSALGSTSDLGLTKAGTSEYRGFDPERTPLDMAGLNMLHAVRTLRRETQGAFLEMMGEAQRDLIGEQSPTRPPAHPLTNCPRRNSTWRSLRVVVERTMVLLEEHWPAVEALASALIEHRRIEGDRIERIIGAASF
jgi:hypothetical protein